MTQLGDQWVEVINGQEHMVKAVAGTNCQGCTFGYQLMSFVPREDGDCEEMLYEHECKIKCPFDTCNLIVKDLGILRNGKLPSSFGVYPTTQAPSKVDENWCLYAWLAENGEVIRKEVALGKTEKQAIDAWNRRA